MIGEMSRIVRTMTNIIFGFIVVFGFYVIAHGHLSPGGGFQGGAIVASAFALLLVTYGTEVIQQYIARLTFCDREYRSDPFWFVWL